MASRKSSAEPTGLARVMYAMARNNPDEEVHVADPREKRAVAQLERDGLVDVRRTKERFAGHEEWWFRLPRRRARASSRDVLTTRKRAKLPSAAFALPGRRALPIQNASHVRNAAARLEQMKNRGSVTRAEYERARRAIRRRERQLGIGPFRRDADTRRVKELYKRGALTANEYAEIVGEAPVPRHKRAKRTVRRTVRRR